MSPEPLRCETRRRASGMGLWRYSMAAVIVVAAMLDVFWWVPTRDARRAERMHQPDEISEISEPVRARVPKCRAAQIKRDMADLQAQMDKLDAELKALGAQLDDAAVRWTGQ